jgi:hypothetical protein
MKKLKIDILFAVIAFREAEFFCNVARFLNKRYKLNSAFLTFYEPADNYLKEKRFKVFSLHKNINLKNVNVSREQIKNIENKYRIKNIRRLLFHEKLTFNRFDENKLSKKLVAYDNYFSSLLQDYEIGNVVQELGGFIAPLSLFYCCGCFNINHIFLEPSMFKGKLFFNVNSKEVSLIRPNQIDKKIERDIKDYVSGYNKDKRIMIPLKDKHHLGFGVKKLINADNFKKLAKKLCHKYIKRETEEYNAIYNHIKRHTLMLLCRCLLKGYYSEPDYSEKYIYFPLHVPLDFQLTVRDYKYINQIALAEYVSSILPYNYNLYIKEHPASVGGYGHHSLKALLKNTNVKLIKPGVNSYDLIKNSVVVFTINSKVGAEALMQGKKVVTVGSPYYKEADNVTTIKNLRELEKIDFEYLDVQTNIDYDFFCKVYMSSYKSELYNNNKQNLQDFSLALHKVINKLKK